MSGAVNNSSTSLSNEMKKQENQINHFSRDIAVGGDLWTDGLICAFEFVRDHTKIQLAQDATREVAKRQDNQSGHFCKKEDFPRSYWIPIGWARITELIQNVQVDIGWASPSVDFSGDENDVITVADVAAPCWEHVAGPTWWCHVAGPTWWCHVAGPTWWCHVAGPTWWCHVAAGHPYISGWLSNAQWLHPAISIALRDESRLISEQMKYLLYEVPVRVAGGLLFQLLGQSAGDPFVEEDDIPIVLRSWQAQNFLVTALHVKGLASKINVLGIAEVQEMLAAGSTKVPTTAHEVIAHLACRLAQWDDRRNQEDMLLFPVILNQEIRRLSTQVIRVKWSLHAREEIVFELLQHLRGNKTRHLLEGIIKSTREIIQEQEAVRGRLFTIQDVMQSTVRAWLQDKSLTVTHNLGVFGGCGLVLSIITGLFGINVDGIPGAESCPYAFLVFSAILVLLGILLIAIGLLYLGLKTPMTEENVEVRKLELQVLVRTFQQEAESHAQVRKTVPRTNIPPTAKSKVPGGAGYVLIS